jgi:hypothetical protein
MRAPENINDESMLRTFETLLQPKRAKMSLATFTKKFLPFLGVEPIPKQKVEAMLEAMSRRTSARHVAEDLHTNLMNEWMNAVQSPFFEVEVFDADGQLVYIVPPILDNTTEISNKTESIPNLVEQAANQTKVYPRLGEQYINDHIIPLLNHVAMRPEYVNMWNKIYAYHGMPLIRGKTESSDQPDSVQPEIDKDKVNSFDDFGD